MAAARSTVQSCALQLTPARQRWLFELDQHPAPLHEYLTQHPTHRLGKYYEQLWHFFLQQDPETELLAHNLPVQGEHRTLGEFDCIYYCARRDCHVHLELAVKYYLGVNGNSAADVAADAERWLGPDSRDSLDAKLEQLLRRQIVLGDLPEAQPALRGLGITNLEKEIALKGYLFWPRHKQMEAPAYNAECRHNHWLHYNELEAYCAVLDASSMVMLPRLRWLSKAHCINRAERIPTDILAQRVAEHFSRDPFPLLIAALNHSGGEQSRFFVTPDRWPQAGQGRRGTIVQHCNIY
jgi:hypothetical protein